MVVIDTLATDPFLTPDLTEVGLSGRKYGVLVREDVVVTYWVDHAEKVIRVLRVEFV